MSIPSPTWLLADTLKRKFGRNSVCGRKAVIKYLNGIYLGSAVFSFFAAYLNTDNCITVIQWDGFYVPSALWGYFLFSRCVEICFAFAKDVSDRLGRKPSATKLTVRDRIFLAIKSYFELIINFAIFYALVPAFWWKCDMAPTKVTDVLYFSATTITTSGSGSMVPINPYLQFATVFEIFSGITLLVGCFTIYTGDRCSCADCHTKSGPG